MVFAAFSGKMRRVWPCAGSWSESSVVHGRVLGSLRITQREVCELNLFYSCLEWILMGIGSQWELC